MVNGAKLAKYNVIVTTNIVTTQLHQITKWIYKSMIYRVYNQLKEFFINCMM
jgi:hypothetical protein